MERYEDIGAPLVCSVSDVRDARRILADKTQPLPSEHLLNKAKARLALALKIKQEYEKGL